MSDQRLGVPEDHPVERAWRLHTRSGVVVGEHAAEIERRKALLREWAAIGRPLR